MTTLAPSSREAAHRREPDAGASSGDDGDLACEPISHVLLTSQKWSVLCSQLSVLMKTFLTSVKASRASGPSSRPMPLAL